MGIGNVQILGKLSDLSTNGKGGGGMKERGELTWTSLEGPKPAEAEDLGQNRLSASGPRPPTSFLPAHRTAAIAILVGSRRLS